MASEARAAQRERVVQAAHLRAAVIIGWHTRARRAGTAGSSWDLCGRVLCCAQREGVGHVRWRDGTYYAGELQQQSPHGRGAAVWADGCVYDGSWRHGLASGHGTLHEPAGSSCDGAWEAGALHGDGSRCSADGCRAWQGKWQRGALIVGEERVWRAVRAEEDELDAPFTVEEIWAWFTEYSGQFGSAPGPAAAGALAAAAAAVACRAGRASPRVACQWASILWHGHGLFTAEATAGLQQLGGGSETYRGQWAWGNRHGEGTLTTPIGHTYSGEWERGELLRGRLVGRWHGDYTGEFKQLKRHGRGVWLSTAGEQSYDGTWEDDRFSGQGVYRSGKARYEGHFVAGQRHGQGVWVSASGDQYEGGFVRDKFEGYGHHASALGSTYKGQFRAGKRHGKGSYTTAQGVRYRGGWADGKRHGYGRQAFADGAVFLGSFVRDVPDGEGVWEDGTDGGGGRFEGNYRGGVRDGAGVWVGADQDRCRGTFANGFLREIGEMTLAFQPEEEVVVGRWVAGAPPPAAGEGAERDVAGGAAEATAGVEGGYADSMPRELLCPLKRLQAMPGTAAVAAPRGEATRTALYAPLPSRPQAPLAAA